MRKSNLNVYTSESDIVETDYKVIVKEHLGADYQKKFSSRLVRKAIRYHVARFVRTEKEITRKQTIYLNNRWFFK